MVAACKEREALANGSGGAETQHGWRRCRKRPNSSQGKECILPIFVGILHHNISQTARVVTAWWCQDPGREDIIVVVRFSLFSFGFTIGQAAKSLFFFPFPLYSSPQLSPLSYHLSTSFSNTPLLLPVLPSLQSIPIPSKRKELHLQPPSSPSSPSLLSPCKQLCPLPTLFFRLPVPPQAPSFPSQPSPGAAGQQSPPQALGRQPRLGVSPNPLLSASC